MAGPQHGIIGDENMGTQLPETQVDEMLLTEERAMARFSKTKEFKRLKDHLEQRIDYYQRFLPGNITPENINEEERGRYWALATLIITEFRAVLDAYEQAAESVETVDAASK